MASRQHKWAKKTHAERRAAGLCKCGRKPTKGYKTCAKCRKAKRRHQRNWYQRHRATTNNESA